MNLGEPFTEPVQIQIVTIARSQHRQGRPLRCSLQRKRGHSLAMVSKVLAQRRRLTVVLAVAFEQQVRLRDGQGLHFCHSRGLRQPRIGSVDLDSRVPLAGATARLNVDGRQHEVKCDDRGAFRFSEIPRGVEFQLTFEAAGYMRYERGGRCPTGSQIDLGILPMLPDRFVKKHKAESAW